MPKTILKWVRKKALYASNFNVNYCSIRWRSTWGTSFDFPLRIKLQVHTSLINAKAFDNIHHKQVGLLSCVNHQSHSSNWKALLSLWWTYCTWMSGRSAAGRICDWSCYLSYFPKSHFSRCYWEECQDSNPTKCRYHIHLKS